MKMQSSVPVSQLYNKGKAPPAPEVEIAKTSEPVDIAKLALEVAGIESEVTAMQEARQSLRERVVASEQAVTACLREYATNPNDMALKRVDEAKEDEAQARKRVHTNNDSLTIRSKDLATLQVQYDEALKTVVAGRKTELLVKRRKQTDKNIKALNKAMLYLMTNEALAGTPSGTISFKSFIQSRLPTIRTDVDAEVSKLLRGLNEH